MNFDEAYNYILSLSNLPRKEYMKEAKKCGWYLKRLNYFLKLLNNPEKYVKKYIHVTGTSGKGSVVNFLHNILLANNKKVGSSYSPHHICITERWKVENKKMTKKEFTEIVEFLKPKFDEYLEKTPYDMLSFTEITEVIGFLFFKQKKVDYVVLEAACGGRYDSSNIIPNNKIAVITNVGLDHIGIIGNNKEEIACEKAGIIKKNSEVFTTEKNNKILNIFKKEIEKTKSRLNIIKNPEYKILEQNIIFSTFLYKDTIYKINTLGNHQILNAILCIEIAKNLKIKDAIIKKGLEHTFQNLRLEIIKQDPLTIIDGAHNPDKMKTTVDSILKLNKKINLIIGFSKNKNIKKQIQLLSKLNLKQVIITRNTSNIFRKVADPVSIQKDFKKINKNLKTKIFLDPKDAYNFTKSKTNKNDILLITGSIFLSGEIKKFMI